MGILKYVATAALGAGLALGAQSCFQKTMYSDLPAAEGRPSVERMADVKIDYKENNGFLEAIIRDNGREIPIYERSGRLLIGSIVDEMPLMTPEEKQYCHDNYLDSLDPEQKEESESIQRDIGRTIGGALRKGKNMLGNIYDGMKDAFND